MTMLVSLRSTSSFSCARRATCSTADQEATLERFVRAGNGWVGIHSASDTEYSWPFYGGLVGAYFREHPEIQEALVRVETAEHPSTATLPATFRRIDEWYAFAENPRPNVTVLLTVDESSYVPGTVDDGNRPSDRLVSHDYEGVAPSTRRSVTRARATRSRIFSPMSRAPSSGPRAATDPSRDDGFTHDRRRKPSCPGNAAARAAVQSRR